MVFLESVKNEGKLKIKRSDLLGESVTDPYSEGLSCLAALPPQAWHLVPEPYSWLVYSGSDKFDDLYNSCFDPVTNVFDARSFQEKCISAVSIMRSQRMKVCKGVTSRPKIGDPDQKSIGDRHIYTGSKFWTVISRSSDPLLHPFAPPKPFAEHVPPLRRNARIKASKLPATSSKQGCRSLGINYDYKVQTDSLIGNNNSLGEDFQHSPV